MLPLVSPMPASFVPAPQPSGEGAGGGDAGERRDGVVLVGTAGDAQTGVLVIWLARR